MGLDVSAWARLERIKGEPDDELIGSGEVVNVRASSAFPGRTIGLADGWYCGEKLQFGDFYSFRAGAYSGYNTWRDWLAKLAGFAAHPSPQERWGTEHAHAATAWEASGGPFWELLHFSDCDGEIGPLVSGMSDRRRIDPEREMAALAAIKAALAEEIAADPDFLLDLAEGETNLLEMLDALAAADLFDDSLIAGVVEGERALAARKDRFETRRKARRAIIEQALLLLDVKKLERPTATFSIVERAPKAEIDDESLIPSRFFETRLALDKKALGEALKAGEAVPGAHLSNAHISLTVRRR